MMISSIDSHQNLMHKKFPEMDLHASEVQSIMVLWKTKEKD
jgi:hypothetical protein